MYFANERRRTLGAQASLPALSAEREQSLASLRSLAGKDACAPSYTLMLEMSYACEDHRKVVLVGGGYDFLVAHRAAGLNDCSDAVTRCFVNAVAEGEEGVGSQN